jgi:1,2-dihydroxy-3-keto-5-methylthiopentene dioxygenase
MQACWLDSETDPLSPETLRAEGVHHQRLETDPAAYQGPLDALKRANGYVHQDEVALTPETPNLEGICAKFVDEHLHDEDEVRFVLEGEGVFEIRSRDDRWMKVTVEKGDLIVVPKDRYHRFYLTDAKTIRCVRLFRDESGWVPHYRAAEGRPA